MTYFGHHVHKGRHGQRPHISLFHKSMNLTSNFCVINITFTNQIIQLLKQVNHHPLQPLDFRSPGELDGWWLELTLIIGISIFWTILEHDRSLTRRNHILQELGWIGMTRFRMSLHRHIRSPNGTRRTPDLAAQTLNWKEIVLRPTDRNPALVNHNHYLNINIWTERF